MYFKASMDVKKHTTEEIFGGNLPAVTTSGRNDIKSVRQDQQGQRKNVL